MIRGDFMRVEPSQLVSGCILLSDVYGKTNQPIIPKDTILSEAHIILLQKFFIETVDVSAKLSDGKPFKPGKRKGKQNKKSDNVPDPSQLSIRDHYKQVVASYKNEFQTWQHQIPVRISSIRKLILPLLERLDELENICFSLHQYATKSEYLYHHHVSVGILSACTAKKMGYSKREWLQAGMAGLLSDCGMAKINPNMIKKNTSLSSSEWEEVRKHSAYSFRLIEHDATISTQVKQAILEHHERMDGSGYPFGLKKDNINVYARIISVCDTYHAMTCERLYQDKQSPFNAIEAIQKAQFSGFDHKVVQAFINSLTNLMTGARVSLSDGRLGEIVFIEQDNPLRPIIKINDSGEIVSLLSNSNLFIKEILSEF